jgi:hypothetical protein
MKWSIEETRRHIESGFGRERLKLVEPSLNSVADRQYHARYHYQEIKRLLAYFKRKHLTKKPLIAVVFDSGRGRGDFDSLMIKIGAHTIAAVLSIHALADLIAQAIYLTLAFDLKENPIREKSVNVNTVKKRLQQEVMWVPIVDSLSRLQGDINFQHVAALANKSKHQNLIYPTLNEDMTGQREQRHEISFAAFQYNGDRYPGKTIEEVLSPAYRLASLTTVEIGNLLNDNLSRN